MSLENDIIAAIKANAYQMNEVIRDAIDELVEVIEDENEAMEEDHLINEDEDDVTDEEE